MGKKKAKGTAKHPPLETSVKMVQSILRKRLAQMSSPPEIQGYTKERQQLFDLLKRTTVSGESNSVLLIGPRGSGKTMLLQSVLTELKEDENIHQNLLQVHLNGLLQTDDRIALKDITRQLQLENTVGDRVFGSFSETLQFLLEALKKGSSQTSKPILFVLDEFDLFAHHRNQTLLYNLFDVSQSAQTPICVVGVTCRLDVIELLEKRVKSRFSHRQIHLFNTHGFYDFSQMCTSYLSLTPGELDATVTEPWNTHVQDLVSEPSVRDVLQRQFNLNKDVRGLIALLTHPICRLSPTHPVLEAGDFLDSFKKLTTDTKSAMLHGVSILELCLIIAMKHLMDIYDGEPFNFEMVYSGAIVISVVMLFNNEISHCDFENYVSEYLKFAQRKSSMQVYEKPVVLKAFEHLMTLEFIRALDGSGSRVQKEYKLMSLLIHPSQIVDALQKYPNCPTEVKQLAGNSVV